MGIPKEITESAFLDGAGHYKIFFRLILPLAKPAIATFAILDFSWQWNDYENALVFLQSPKLYTIPLGLQNFILENNVDYNGMMKYFVGCDHSNDRYLLHRSEIYYSRDF